MLKYLIFKNLLLFLQSDYQQPTKQPNNLMNLKITRKSLLAILLTVTAGLVSGAPLTPEEALSRLHNRSHKLQAASAMNPNPVFTLADAKGIPTIFVFENRNNGTLFVSADDIARPILGYTDSSFDKDNMPPAMRAWLDGYCHEIEQARLVGITDGYPAEENLPAWKAIDPMVNSRWNQDAPYNNLCPELNGKKTVTGCVATGMAQMMYYYKYPEIGTGKISYNCRSINKQLSLDLSAQKFDWDNMVDEYRTGDYNKTQADAVAYLMQACGYSMQMQYGLEGSGAYSQMIPNALKTYFGYDSNTRYETRANYTYNDWCEIIYNDLVNVGPVMYSGTSNEGGHLFICDGYDGSGYFHFNWGWSGVSDGYFSLDALNPTNIGIGGFEGGFNFTQGVVLGMQPPTGQTYEPKPEPITQAGGFEGRIQGSKLFLNIYEGVYMTGWYNPNPYTVSAEMGVIIDKKANPGNPIVVPFEDLAYDLDSFNGFFFEGDDYFNEEDYPMIDLSTLNLENDVDYTVTAAFTWLGEDEMNWQPIKASIKEPVSFKLTKKGDTYEVENYSLGNFTISNVEILSPINENSTVNLKANITNNYNNQLSCGVGVVLLDSRYNILYINDGFMLTLNEGETVVKEWSANIGKLGNTSQLYLMLYDMDSNIYHDMDPVLVADKTNDELELSGSIDIIGSYESDGVAIVNNCDDMKLNFVLRCLSGTFNQRIGLCLLEPRNDGSYQAVMADFMNEVPDLVAGQNKSFVTDIQFPQAKPGVIYILDAFYETEDGQNYLWVDINRKFMIKESGVESINGDTGDIRFIRMNGSNVLSIVSPTGIENVTAYNTMGALQPIKVDYSTNGATIDLSNIGNGIIIISAIDKIGNKKSIKISI